MTGLAVVLVVAHAFHAKENLMSQGRKDYPSFPHPIASGSALHACSCFFVLIFLFFFPFSLFPFLPIQGKCGLESEKERWKERKTNVIAPDNNSNGGRGEEIMNNFSIYFFFFFFWSKKNFLLEMLGETLGSFVEFFLRQKIRKLEVWKKELFSGEILLRSPLLKIHWRKKKKDISTWKQQPLFGDTSSAVAKGQKNFSGRAI